MLGYRCAICEFINGLEPTVCAGNHIEPVAVPKRDQIPVPKARYVKARHGSAREIRRSRNESRRDGTLGTRRIVPSLRDFG